MILHNIRSIFNVGSALRTADAFGIGEVIISGFTPSPDRSEITKTAIGAEKYVDWSITDDIADYLSSTNITGYDIIGIEQTNVSIPLHSYAPTASPFCLVFGNEVTGIDDEVLPLLDTVLEIPQFGHKHSLNVSVTIGISIHSLLAKLL